MNISDIQKCQEEYEKLLKESPLHGTIDKICKDILEQKNNAMAMEFTRIICDLLKRYGVYVHCTETKFGEKITENSIEEKWGIVFDSMDFSQHDKEFTDKIKELEEELEKSNREHAKTLWEYCDSVKKEEYESEVNRLQSEVNHYRKAFEEAKKERDCQIAEYRKKIEGLTAENEKLKGNVGSKGYREKQEKTNNFYCIFANAANNLTKDDLLVFLGILAKELAENGIDFRYEMEKDPKVWDVKIKRDKNIADVLPTEPIKVADMLINASKKRINCMTGKEYDKYIFEKWQLRQIAEHLLVYCNHNGEAEK